MKISGRDAALQRLANGEARSEEASPTAAGAKVICPVCGAAAVQEKCKVICRSDICRGRVVMNCSEF